MVSTAIIMPRTTMRQFAIAEANTSLAVGCFFMARKAGVSSSDRRNMKMTGIMMQPTKNGMRHLAMPPMESRKVSLGMLSLRIKPMTAATKIATC